MSDPEIGHETKPNPTLKLGHILKLNMVLELAFRVKIVCIQNFKLILNILEHVKPSISSLKQPGSLPIGKNSNVFKDAIRTIKEI